MIVIQIVIEQCPCGKEPAHVNIHAVAAKMGGEATPREIEVSNQFVAAQRKVTESIMEQEKALGHDHNYGYQDKSEATRIAGDLFDRLKKS